MRLYEPTVAQKLRQVFGLDAAFSSSSLAAPAVAGMTLGTRVLSSCTIAGVAHVAAEIDLAFGCALAGSRVADAEAAHGMRVLARTGAGAGAVPDAPPAADQKLVPGDRLVVHAPMPKLPALTAAAGGGVQGTGGPP